MSEPLRLLFASDIHFGIPTMPQHEMAKAFADTIFPLLADTDIFFINGDFFDRLVIFDNHGFDPVYDTMMTILALCERHGVCLRVLQGTWEHDRNQLRRFEAFYRNGRFSFDFRFAETIELETITVKDRSLRILYVPDDLPYSSSEDIVLVIEEKLLELGWDYVDYACMHGFFEFTFPANVSQLNRVVYKESQFNFVRKVVDVGHVHQHRIHGKLISNGSFDRSVHGDEDPKGCIRVFDYPDHYTAQFIENTDAAIYHTLVFSNDDTTETIRERITTYLEAQTSKRKISLRFQTETTEMYGVIKAWMKDTYPDVHCRSKKSTEKDEQKIVNTSSPLFTTLETRVVPTPKTIASFIRNRMPSEYALTTDAIDVYLETDLG